MREILFRGKAANRKSGYAYRTKYKNGDWVYGLLTDVENYAGFSEMTNANGVRGVEVDKNTVGQFTGLISKGKQWFEHDIISVRDDGEEIYRFVIAFGVCGGAQNVKHTVGYTGFHVIPANQETQRCMDAGARNDPLYWLNAYDCEVIGNIHDNPELLGGVSDGKA